MIVMGNSPVTLSSKTLKPNDIYRIEKDHLVFYIDTAFLRKFDFASDIKHILYDIIIEAIKSGTSITIFYHTPTSTIHCIEVGNRAYPSSLTMPTTLGWELE